LKRWEPEGTAPAWLALDDGRALAIAVSREVLSECSRNHILRFQAAWPPAADRAARAASSPSTSDSPAESATER
jgi:hypothetical protein